MPRVIQFEGRLIEVPDDATDEEVAEILSAYPPSSGGESATQATQAPQTPAWQRGLDYADDTGAIVLRNMRRGLSAVLGLPVDAVNAGLGALGVPVSEEPFLGSAMIDKALGAPAQATAAVVGADTQRAAEGPTPQDAFQRVAGRTGYEIGAGLLPVGGAIVGGARLGVQGARALQKRGTVQGLAGQAFEAGATNPVGLAGREMRYAGGAGIGAGLANEAAGNPQHGDNFWSDFLGSMAGVAGTAAVGRLGGAAKNVAGAVTGDPRFMDDVAGEEVAARIISHSSDMAGPIARGETVDTTPLVTKLRRPAPIEEAVPGYQANIGDRTQDPGLYTLAYNADTLLPGAANVRRVANNAAVDRRMNELDPGGDPAQFRAALEANRDARIAEAERAAEQQRRRFEEAALAARPVLADATARGSSARSALADVYAAERERIRQAFAPIDEAQFPISVRPLAEGFAEVQQRLPLNDQARFLPSEVNVAARLGEAEQAPLREVTALRSGLSDDIRTAEAAGEAQRARVARQFRGTIDEFLEQNMPPELREAYQAANAVRRDVADRFERPGTAIQRTLQQREGGGYALDDSAVTPQFVQTDQGRINDFRAAMREAGNDPRLRNALADEVLADVQRSGLLDRPDALRKYLGERNIFLSEFPELRQKLEAAAEASEAARAASRAAETTRRDLTTPGRTAQATYLKYGDEATVDAVRAIMSSAKPRDAVRELLEAAGNSPEARRNARSALWEVVKRQKFSAPDMAGQERWNPRKLKGLFDDPKVAAVAEELWKDNPEDLAAIKQVVSALAGAEGSVRARAPNASGTAQTIYGRFDPALTPASLASRGRSVSRNQMSLPIAIIDVTSTYLRRKSAQVQSRAIDTLTAAVVNNPGLAADLLEEYNPATWAAKRRMILQKYGVRATQVLNVIDEALNDDPVMDAVTEPPEPMTITVRPRRTGDGR